MMVFVLSLCFCFDAAASETSSVPLGVGVAVPKPNVVNGIPLLAFSLPWWGIGLGLLILVSIILYFIAKKMERKSDSEFEATIIEDIISTIKMEYSLCEEELRKIVVGIITDHRCDDPRLDDLLRVEYEVEKVDSSLIRRITAVVLKRQGEFVLKKATRTMAWEAMPRKIRSDFIVKKAQVLVFSLYSANGKDI